MKKRLHYFFPLVILALCTFTVQAQTIQLPVTWKFSMGDNAEWTKPTLNDSLWENKNVGLSWSATGHPGNVYAWYRIKIIIPSSMKDAIVTGNGLKLGIGKIDDVDQTFFNGQLIGETGSFPPQYKTAWDTPRVYIIPPDNVLYDKENVIAVRLFSPDIGGIGMYQGPYVVAPVQWSDVVAVTHDISETTKDSFITTISFSNKGYSSYKGTLKYFVQTKSNKDVYREIREVMLRPAKENTFSFTAEHPDKENIVKIGYRFTEADSKSSIVADQLYLTNTNINIPAAGVPVQQIQDAVPTKYTSLPFGDLQLNGYLGIRSQKNLTERLLNVDEKGITDSYLRRPGTHPWIGEHIGKYLEAASNMWKFTGDDRLKKQMDRIMFLLINTQLEDGYLGTYIPGEYWTSWDVWSHKYNLYGLLGYYGATGYLPALNAGKKIGDLLCRTFGNQPGQRDIILAGEHVGMAATSVLDPMVELYKYTGEKKYLDFCLYIVNAMEQRHGPKIISTLMESGKVNAVANGKAYEMLSNLVGLVNLYRITGDERFFTPAVRAWEDIVTNRLYITGTTSSWEHFQADSVLPASDNDHIGEGCVTVTWIQLNRMLLEVTGKLRYAEQIEKSVYNHLLAAENPQNGCVSYYTPLMDQKPFISSISCCTSSIPRGIAMIPYFPFGNVNGVPTLMLYEPGSYKDVVTTKESKSINVSIAVKGSFPEQGTMVVTVDPVRAAAFSFALRVPSWCSEFTALAGGKVYKGAPGEYLTIARTWRKKDKINVRFDMPVQTLSGGKSYPGRIAFQRGPQVLAYDGALNSVQIPDSTLPTTTILTPEFNYVPNLLTKEWIGTQSYIIPLPENNTAKSSLVLVPYADASQSGGVVKVWLPLNIVDGK